MFANLLAIVDILKFKSIVYFNTIDRRVQSDEI